MTREEISGIVASQRDFFKTGVTYDVNWRIEQLKKLYAAISRHEEDICQALHEDLGRSHAEGYICDVLPTLAEISENIKHLKSWARPEKHFSGLLAFPSVTTSVNFLPYGVSLIIAPFNFPFMLSLGVLNAAISGGNTAVIKVSSKSEACSKVIEQICDETFPPEYVKVIGGGHDVADFCLEERFDKIFYTGSPKVAKHVMECAAKNLTPVALELGGETGNWAIVRKDANLKDAARKIAFFKVLNSGQICININQVAVAEEIAEEFIEELKKALIKCVGENPELNPEYPKLISNSAYEKCGKEADEYRNRIVFGGKGDETTCKYAPTVIYPVDIDEKIVQHELFCSLLPVVKFKDSEVDKLISTIEEREHGLALYVFTRDTRWAKRTMRRMQFGGGCINEVVMHIMVKGVPFNGTGHSGMGAYHGIWGFREFTHPQTILKGCTRFNLPLREHPYEGKDSKRKLAILKLFAR